MASEGYDDLLQHVVESMPVRTRALGRRHIEELVRDVVWHWPVDELAGLLGDEPQRRRVIGRLTDRIARQRTHTGKKRHGSMLLLFALSTVISLVFQWWLSRRNTPAAGFIGLGRQR
jgi:hypothetical protein